MNKTLLDIEINHKTIISHYEDDALSTAFSCIGLLPGCEITLINKLPFKGPITCECKNTKFAIRAEDAAQVFVSSK